MTSASSPSVPTPVSGMDLFTDPTADLAFPDPLPPEPMPLLATWFDEALAAQAAPNPDAMVLATINDTGEPSARVVLCKGMDLQHGYLIFYTNYDSRKARDLARRPAAAATFHWDAAGRQARVQGVVVRSPAEESDAYFATRPLLSKLGAWASRQSQTLRSRDELIEQVAATMLRFGIDMESVLGGASSAPIPRPPNWGGYRLWIHTVELWSGGPGRLHERAHWQRDLERPDPAGPGDTAPVPSSTWRSARLQP